MIWIETLSRHKEPVSRFRCDQDAATIGRGYDNDAVIDDPYVAPRHLRIRRDDDGALVAEDLGSQNGLFDEVGRRQQSLRLTGDTLIRIGQTWMRVRESAFAVAPERKLQPVTRSWPWLLALMILTPAVLLLTTWLEDSSERPHTALVYLGTLLSFSLLVALWVGFWAFMSRIFLGHARATSQAIIALGGLMVSFIALFLQNWLSFAFSSRLIAQYSFIFYWILLAAVCLAHLRAIRVRCFLRKAAIVSVLALCACLAEWVAENPFSSDESSDSGFYLKRMFPPAWRLAAPRTETEFIEAVYGIKNQLDDLRAKNPGGKATDQQPDGAENAGSPSPPAPAPV